MKTTTFLLFILINAILFAQNKNPESTELYSPVPPIVTPGEGNKPPSDAIVLFDGSNCDQWENAKGNSIEWVLADGCMKVKPFTGDIRTKRGFGDCQLHIEWLCPSGPVEKNVLFNEAQRKEQGFGNSGVFFQGKYELQIFDSYNYPLYHNDKPIYTNGQAGSIYKQVIPLVNACKKPGEWQSFDVIFMSPRFSENGRVAIPGRITVLQNGVLVLNNFEIQGEIKYIGAPEYKAHNLKEPIMLQDHGDEVSFRNIWIREL